MDIMLIIPIMLALCLMLSKTYYAQNYAGIIGLGLIRDDCEAKQVYITADVPRLPHIQPWPIVLNFLPIGYAFEQLQYSKKFANYAQYYAHDYCNYATVCIVHDFIIF